METVLCAQATSLACIQGTNFYNLYKGDHFPDNSIQLTAAKSIEHHYQVSTGCVPGCDCETHLLPKWQFLILLGTVKPVLERVGEVRVQTEIK